MPDGTFAPDEKTIDRTLGIASSGDDYLTLHAREKRKEALDGAGTTLAELNSAVSEKSLAVGSAFLKAGLGATTSFLSYRVKPSQMLKAGVDLVTSGLSIYFSVKGLGVASDKLEAKQDYFDSLKDPDSYKTFLPEGHPDAPRRKSATLDGGPKGGTVPA